MKIAILDLGTNVFNLLICEVNELQCAIIEEYKVSARLGDGGLSNGILSPVAFLSSEEAIIKILKVINDSGGVEEIHAFATSAVRDSINGKEFANNLLQKFNINVSIISGDREAELIYKGVREALFIYDEVFMIMDIGGGSNEFVIANKREILWKESFPLGMARLLEVINPSNPITEEEVDKLVSFVDPKMDTLWTAFQKFRPKFLIGSSGSFDTIRDMLYEEGDDKSLPAKEIDRTKLFELHKRLLCSTKVERMLMPGMSSLRVDFMVLSSIFIQHILFKCDIREIYQSSYSLKEGVMAEKHEYYKNKSN